MVSGRWCGLHSSIVGLYNVVERPTAGELLVSSGDCLKLTLNANSLCLRGTQSTGTDDYMKSKHLNHDSYD